MKTTFQPLFIILCILYSNCWSQSNTEVFLFDLKKINDTYQLSNKKNISNNEGYDSQPYFYSSSILLFSGTRNGQTDIVRYNIKHGNKIYLSNTPKGGEYSPQRIPFSRDVSAVRLDDTGLQRFYRYPMMRSSSKVIIPNLKVAYPLWIDKNRVVSAVIGENSLELVLSNLKEKKNIVLQTQVGRSLHKIPGTNKISFIYKGSKNWEIHALNLKDLSMEKIKDLSGKFEDICWLADGTMLQAKENKLLSFNPKTDQDWKDFYVFPKNEITAISRICVSPDGKTMALVAESGKD